jgi:hypothetical protein
MLAIIIMLFAKGVPRVPQSLGRKEGRWMNMIEAKTEKTAIHDKSTYGGLY